MRRLLVTGGAGFIGHHFIEHVLKNTSAEIVVVDKLTYASRGLARLRDIESLFGGRVKVLTADIASGFSEGVIRELDLPTLDYVIHAAAETHVDNSIVDPLPFVNTNVVGTHHVLSLGRRSDCAVKRFVLIETDEVYGPALDGVSYREDDRHSPRNPYAATKSAAEQLATAYAHTYNIPIQVMTAMNAFGERQHIEKFLPKVIRHVIEGDEVMIHSYPGRVRSGSRFYLHCRSFSDAILFALRLPTCTKFHVSGDREVTNLELAERVASIIGKPLRHKMVDFHSERPGHDLRYALDDTKLRSIGWRAPVGFDESLERTVQWYVEHPDWLCWA